MRKGKTAVFSCERQLYKRLCPSIRQSVRGSVTRFSNIAKTGRIQVNSSKFKQIQVNSTKFTTFCNCWPGDGLVYHSNPCENIPNLAVAKGVAKEENVLDNG